MPCSSIHSTGHHDEDHPGATAPCGPCPTSLVPMRSPYTGSSSLHLDSPATPGLKTTKRTNMLKCHNCHPLQAVRPAKPLLAAAKPIPNSAPVTASPWSPASAQARGAAPTQAGTVLLMQLRVSAPNPPSLLRFMRLQLFELQTVLLYQLQVRSAGRGLGEAARLREGE